jgi:hypothetical protein
MSLPHSSSVVLQNQLAQVPSSVMLELVLVDVHASATTAQAPTRATAAWTAQKSPLRIPISKPRPRA